jgi:hypothetical protein
MRGDCEELTDEVSRGARPPTESSCLAEHPRHVTLDFVVVVNHRFEFLSIAFHGEHNRPLLDSIGA